MDDHSASVYSDFGSNLVERKFESIKNMGNGGADPPVKLFVLFGKTCTFLWARPTPVVRHFSCSRVPPVSTPRLEVR